MTNPHFDAEFSKKINELRPDWVTPLSEAAEQKKKELLKMSSIETPKPTFDPKFDKEIREIRPDWFI